MFFRDPRDPRIHFLKMSYFSGFAGFLLDPQVGSLIYLELQKGSRLWIRVILLSYFFTKRNREAKNLTFLIKTHIKLNKIKSRCIFPSFFHYFFIISLFFKRLFYKKVVFLPFLFRIRAFFIFFISSAFFSSLHYQKRAHFRALLPLRSKPHPTSKKNFLIFLLNFFYFQKPDKKRQSAFFVFWALLSY